MQAHIFAEIFQKSKMTIWKTLFKEMASLPTSKSYFHFVLGAFVPWSPKRAMPVACNGGLSDPLDPSPYFLFSTLLFSAWWLHNTSQQRKQACENLGPNIHWTSNYGTGIVFIGNMLSWLSFHNRVWWSLNAHISVISPNIWDLFSKSNSSIY